MSFHRRQVTRIDANAPDIIDALRKAGCTVEVIGYPVDLAVRHPSYPPQMWKLVEVKDATKTGRTYTMTPSKTIKMKRQIDFIAANGVPVVTSVEQALACIGATR